MAIPREHDVYRSLYMSKDIVLLVPCEASHYPVLWDVVSSRYITWSNQRLLGEWNHEVNPLIKIMPTCHSFELTIPIDDLPWTFHYRL